MSDETDEDEARAVEVEARRRWAAQVWRRAREAELRARGAEPYEYPEHGPRDV